MSPSGIHSVTARLHRRLDNQVHIGVVVNIRTAGHISVVIRQANKFCVSLEVLRCGHNLEEDDVRVANVVKDPRPDAPNAFDGGEAVVGD